MDLKCMKRGISVVRWSSVYIRWNGSIPYSLQRWVQDFGNEWQLSIPFYSCQKNDWAETSNSNKNEITTKSQPHIEKEQPVTWYGFQVPSRCQFQDLINGEGENRGRSPLWNRTAPLCQIKHNAGLEERLSTPMTPLKLKESQNKKKKMKQNSFDFLKILVGLLLYFQLVQ